MGFFKSSNNDNESGLSLLQGLAILAVLGIVGTILFRYLAG